MVKKHNSAIIDTSYLVSLYIETDSKHNDAISFHTKIIDIPNLYITNFIFLETYTILAMRIGKSKATKILNDLTTMGIKEIFADRIAELEIRKFYSGINKKDISYVDASIAFLAQKLNIDGIITFDKHFKYFSNSKLGIISHDI